MEKTQLSFENAMQVLHYIQQHLNAPKNMYNSFGKYKYRSCEGILEALKPLLNETGSVLMINDELTEIGSRIYVKATAYIYLPNSEGSYTTMQNSAYAREADVKGGMDAAQITGAASSYARKYALNGLFLIDDTKDPDTDEYTKTDKAMARKNAGGTPAAQAANTGGNPAPQVGYTTAEMYDAGARSTYGVKFPALVPAIGETNEQEAEQAIRNLLSMVKDEKSMGVVYNILTHQNHYLASKFVPIFTEYKKRLKGE